MQKSHCTAICPKCRHRMKTTHAYECAPGAKTQRLECTNCLRTFTAVTITTLVAEDPGYGEGPKPLAKRLAADIKGVQNGIAALSAMKTSGKGV